MIILALIFMVLHPDLDLIGQALGGKRAAQRMLVNRLTPVIWAHVQRALLRSRLSMESYGADLTQHIWARLWADNGRLLHRFQPAQASLEHYIGGIITRSEVRDWLRSRAAAQHGGEVQHVDLDEMQGVRSTDQPDQRVVDADLGRRVFAHLDENLSGRGRIILQMIYQDNLEPPAIAGALGVKVHVVHNWQARIRKQARAFLATC